MNGNSWMNEDKLDKD